MEQSLEDDKWVGVADVQLLADQMDLAIFGEDTVAGVFNLAGEKFQLVLAELQYLGVPEQHQVGLEMLRWHPLPDGVINKPAGEVAFLDAGASPVDDLRREDAADLQLLADGEQQHVD